MRSGRSDRPARVPVPAPRDRAKGSARTASSPPTEPRREPRTEGELVYGLRAVLAVFEQRRDALLRVAYAPANRARLTELLRFAAARRIPCEAAGDAELERFAGTRNHEGLCASTAPRRWASPNELAEALLRKRGACVAFDRVRNPYNIGALLRTAAFLGLDAALLGAPAPHPALAADAVRVAEGGAEHLLLARTTDLAETLARLRARGVRIVGGESDGVRAFGFRFERPTVLVLGNEREGLGPRVRAQCDAMVAIPGGTRSVGSLNVSVAGAILMAEMVRA
jgi:TrmH RNA methyltransferase